MEGIPRRIGVAFLKYHSIVLVMRLYEYVASRFVDDEALDKLTIDTFECSKRDSQSHKTGGALFGAMLNTCWRANMISFLADYSVHQIILAYGYYIYIRDQRRRLKRNDGTAIELHGGPLAMSFIQNSTQLAVSRGVSLGLSSLGGALGTVMWPGWGTLAGTNLGDSLALQLTDDVESPSTQVSPC